MDKNPFPKRWNFIHGSIDHLWGERYFARIIKSHREYEYVMNYIDKNPVVAKLALYPEEWKSSGAFYKAHDISGLVDYFPQERLHYIKLLGDSHPAVCLNA